MDAKERIARRAALEMKDGWCVNLGIGIPTLVANYLPPEVTVVFHSENGFLGLGPAPAPEDADPLLVNAGGVAATILPGGMCFDSAFSFALIRGGHLDATVLGALQADASGRIASWVIPGVRAPGMGGAMDLMAGAKRVFIAMQHTAGNEAKILAECTLPLTSQRRADLIITDLCVLRPCAEGLVLEEIAPEATLDEIRQKTAAPILVPAEPRVMQT